MTRRSFRLSAILTVLLLAPLAGAQTSIYHAFLWTAAGGMQDLGTIPGWQESNALAISQFGQVVGELLDPTNGKAAAFAGTVKNGMHLLKGLNANTSFATGVNSSLQIVGAAYALGAIEPHAFLWTQSGGTQDLGTLGGNASEALGVNRYGEVVGEAATESGAQHAFHWTQNGGMQDLGTLDGGSISSVAYAINDNGVIVGSSTGPDNLPVAVFWQGGQIHCLGILSAGRCQGYPTYPEQSAANGINNVGQAVGFSTSGPNYPLHAVLWTAGGAQDLGILPDSQLCAGVGVNNSGEVAGWCAIGRLHQAFVWTSAGGMQAIGTLGGANSAASGINGSGQIVGWSDLP
jgi:probable HAF family extracellular repeat protein